MLNSMVSHYIDHWTQKGEIKWYASAVNLPEAIERACRSVDENGCLHPHQWRISRCAFDKSVQALLRNEATIRKSKNFCELLSAVECALKPVHGAGKLLSYDTALRIGWYRKLYPIKVYLHAGTKIGAQNLGLNARGRSMFVDQFPEEISTRLNASNIENFLCIYKEVLKSVVSTGRVDSDSWPKPRTPHNGGANCKFPIAHEL